MIWAFLLRFWQPAVGILAVGIIWLCVLNYGAHRFNDGVQQTRSEDAKLAAAQKALNDEQRKRDEARAQYADRQHEIDMARMAALNSQRRTDVVCNHTESRSRPVPATARVPEPEASRDRPLPEPAGRSVESFNPTDALYALAEEADEMLASCRYLNMYVHGMPSAPQSPVR